MSEGYAELLVNISLSGYIRVPLDEVPSFDDDMGLEELAEEWWHDSIDVLDLTVDSVYDVVQTEGQRVTHRLTEDGWEKVGKPSE